MFHGPAGFAESPDEPARRHGIDSPFAASTPFQFYQPLRDWLAAQKQEAIPQIQRLQSDWSSGRRGTDLNWDSKTDSMDVFYLAGRWPFATTPAILPSDLPSWKASRGEWYRVDDGIHGTSDLDSRAVFSVPFPSQYEITIEIDLVQGNSAGFMVWTDQTGDESYLVRIDAVAHRIVLSELKPWPIERILDSYPLPFHIGRPIVLQIKTFRGGLQVYLADRPEYPVIHHGRCVPTGTYAGFYLQDASAAFTVREISVHDDILEPPAVPRAGEFVHIFDQSVGENEPWYINDHCFVHHQDRWRLFGITNPYPPDPANEDRFAHASSPALLQTPWIKHPFALETDESAGESFLWAPHIVERDGLFYMFYSGGSLVSGYEYGIFLAISDDLFEWTRFSGNPLFQDFFDARDPMVWYDRTMGQYILYYTAGSERPAGSHIVAYRTSRDLIHWSPRRVAFESDSTGTSAGPTESPFVVEQDGYFYLLIGPDPNDYRTTHVYRSASPYYWTSRQWIASIPSHAPEVIRDTNGEWFISHCGWFYNGVYLAPLRWDREPVLRIFVNLGERFDYLTAERGAFVSDWNTTSQLDLTADFSSSFDMSFPIPEANDTLQLRFEERGETRLDIYRGDTWTPILDQGDSGPGFVETHALLIERRDLVDGRLTLRFSDSDPSDGWGPNVNWIGLYW